MGCGSTKHSVHPGDDIEDAKQDSDDSDDDDGLNCKTRITDNSLPKIQQSKHDAPADSPSFHLSLNQNTKAMTEIKKGGTTPPKDELQIQKGRAASDVGLANSRMNIKAVAATPEGAETDPRLNVFIEQAEKAIGEINEMQLTVESIPECYDKAKTLRSLYHKARYDYGEEFCLAFLDATIEFDLVPCLRDGLRMVQTTFPDIFTEPSDASFKALPYPKLVLDNYGPPETAAGCVWVKLNSTVLGMTDLYEYCRLKSAENGLLEYYLTEILPAVSEGAPPLTTLRGKVLENTMAAIYNISLCSSNFRYFQKFQGLDRLLPLMNTPSEKVNMNALFALAYLTDETNNELIMSNNDTIDKIIFYLQNAIKRKSRRYKGMSSVELANALKQIAVNDHNKKLIGGREGLTGLLAMLNTALSDEERISASKALWMLLFDEDNKKILKDTEDGIKQIKTYSTCENKQLRKVISGILWELQTKYEQTERAMSYSDLRQDEGEQQHLMISYQWDEQPTMLKIRDALKKEGYKVWMDVDKLGGSTLEAMAAGIENAAVVLIAVSRKYKQSVNCRSEAEYAFQLKKDIIPLMLEPQYQPDGWLGIVVGAKFWLDFSTKSKVGENANKLLKEIGDRGRVGNETIVKAIDELDLGGAHKKKHTKEDVQKWSTRQVKKWMGTQGLHETSIKKTILDRLTGRRLILLLELHDKCPEFYFKSLRNDFGFADVLLLLDFTDALKNLLENA